MACNGLRNVLIFVGSMLNKPRVWSLELVSFLVGLRTYQHLFVCMYIYIYIYFSKNPIASIYKQNKTAVRSTECLSVPNRQDGNTVQNTVPGYVKHNYIRSSALHIIPEAITSYTSRTHCSVSIRMTEYKWQTSKALSLPSSIPCLLLNITFPFFLITQSSFLNTFHKFFFTVLFFDSFLFLKILLL